MIPLDGAMELVGLDTLNRQVKAYQHERALRIYSMSFLGDIVYLLI